MKGNVFRGVIAAAAAGAAAYFQELALPVVVLFLVMVMDKICVKDCAGFYVCDSNCVFGFSCFKCKGYYDPVLGGHS